MFRAGFDSGYDRDKNRLVQLRNHWHEWRYSNRSLAQAKANARFHYGLGIEFYRPWLDTARHDVHVRATGRKARRRSRKRSATRWTTCAARCSSHAGETFIDVGCGWGGLLFHAWENYGALGTGHQRHDGAGATRRAPRSRAAGSTDKIAVVECDMREMPGQYDKLLSIGTLEHAGSATRCPRSSAPTPMRSKPGGLGVIHFIGHVGTRDTEFYIREYIFPGGWIPSLSQAIDWMERCGLEVVDVENLRRHYALTLDVWAERFDRNWDDHPARSTRSASTSASAASGARTCGRAPRCSGRRIRSSTCSR